MIHLWVIDDNDDLILNTHELLKYPLLANIYKQDSSPRKELSYEYFKYIDFMTTSAGYCNRHGLNNKEAHKYSLSQTRLPKDFKFPSNNDTILKYVKDNIEFDVEYNLIRIAVKALRVSTKNLEAYIDTLNELETAAFKDAEGKPIDISNIVSKTLNTISNIPKDIKKLEELLELEKNKKAVVRGSVEFSHSMDSDAVLDRYVVDSDDDDN